MRKGNRYRRGRIQHCLLSLAVVSIAAVTLYSCRQANSRLPTPVSYEHFKDSILSAGRHEAFDSINVFDAGKYVPVADSEEKLFNELDSMWTNDQGDSAQALAVTEERSREQNLSALRSYRTGESGASNENTKSAGSCKEISCTLFAEIIKSRQVLYLYLNGALVDSFQVSTGIRGRETPSFSLHPSGPIFIHYNSKKFPGGDYKGLGNMPYAIFIKGGYAIHGTTPGNFSRLGKPASHGCIRLHPDNAKVFINLVEQVGLRNTWITIKNT
jgi:hypothetical protein